MSDALTITGLVATTQRHIVSSEGLTISSFRLASTRRQYDIAAEKWMDRETKWYTVTLFRQLATHVAESVTKDDGIVVVGKLRIREWESDERTGTNIEIEADAFGHDLTWGTGVFREPRLVRLPPKLIHKRQRKASEQQQSQRRHKRGFPGRDRPGNRSPERIRR